MRSVSLCSTSLAPQGGFANPGGAAYGGRTPLPAARSDRGVKWSRQGRGWGRVLVTSLRLAYSPRSGPSATPGSLRSPKAEGNDERSEERPDHRRRREPGVTRLISLHGSSLFLTIEFLSVDETCISKGVNDVYGRCE